MIYLVKARKLKLSVLAKTNNSDIWLEIEEITKEKNKVIIHDGKASFPVSLPLPGLFNIFNALSAVGAVRKFNFTPDEIKKGLEKLNNIPGRLEYIKRETAIFYYC